MLKKFGWALVALAMLAGLARAAGDGAGGMSINSLSTNITTALATLGTNIVNAITNTAVQTCAPGATSCTQALLVQGAVGATPVNTAPQSNVPAAFVTGTLANAGDAVTISGVDGYGTLSVEAIGPATWTGTTIVEMQPKSSSQWYTTQIGYFEGSAPGVSALPQSVAAQLFFKTGGVAALRIRAVTAITNGPLAINLAGMASLKDLRASAPVTNPVSAQLAIGGAAASLTNPYPFGDVVAGAVVSNANPKPTSAPSVGPQRSAAAETCHTFTKGTSGANLRAVSVSGASTQALWLFLLDATTAPTSPSDQHATWLMAPQKMGSDGTDFQGVGDLSGAPIPTNNTVVACLSTTRPPTYTAAGAVGWFVGQVQ